MISCKEIEERKSVRMFSKQHSIDKENVINIISAATLAPSAHNSQPWRFYIVDKDREGFLEFFPNNRWMRTAPYFIIVYMKPTPGIDREKEIMAIGAAIENMLLEAQAECISSCWVGECTERKEQINNWTGIHDAELMAVVAFGKKRMDSERCNRKSLEEVIYNRA